MYCNYTFLRLIKSVRLLGALGKITNKYLFWIIYNNKCVWISLKKMRWVFAFKLILNKTCIIFFVLSYLVWEKNTGI